MRPELDEQLFEALDSALRGRKLHSTRVERVDLRRGLDADGNPALFIHLTLTDPPEGAETSETDDVRRPRMFVRDAVVRMLRDEELRWYVSFDSEAAELNPDVT
jgi:hypothetical protein